MKLFQSTFSMKKHLENVKNIRKDLIAMISSDIIRKFETSAILYRFIGKSFESLSNIGMNHFKVTNSNLCFQLIAFSILTKGSVEITNEHQNDMKLILNSINSGNVEMAEKVHQMLKEISSIIVNSGKCKEFQRIDKTAAINWMKNSCKEAFDLFEKFIIEHDHASLNELEFIPQTFAIEPENVIDMIKTKLKFEGIEKDGASFLTPDEVIENLKTPLNDLSKFILRKIIFKIQEGVNCEEESKSNLEGAIDLLRKALIVLSGKMLNEGLLPSKDLIFHLTWNEIRDVIIHRDSGLIVKALRRQKLFPQLNELTHFGLDKRKHAP